MRIALIPARGGSKRIPRKNIRPFLGKPIITYPIEVARASGLFERILVSTEDSEIAALASKHGAEVPFLRPGNLADDYATTAAVLAHAVQWMNGQRWAIDTVCCIYATAALIQTDDLKRGLDALESGAWDYAFSVTEFAAPIFRAFRARSDGGLEMFFPEHAATRSQDLPVALHDAGQFYWGRAASWLECKPIFDRRSRPVLVPRWRVQDIDTPEDWSHAELIKRSLGESGC